MAFTIDELNRANQVPKQVNELNALYLIATSKYSWDPYQKMIIKAHLKNGYGPFLRALFQNRPRFLDLAELERQMENEKSDRTMLLIGLLGCAVVLCFMLRK